MSTRVDELAERTERRTGEHARDEAVRERHDDPALVERERGRAHDDHPGGDERADTSLTGFGKRNSPSACIAPSVDVRATTPRGACPSPPRRRSRARLSLWGGTGWPGCGRSTGGCRRRGRRTPRARSRPDAGVVGDLRLHLVVAEREHAAVGVVDEDDLLGAEQALRDRQRADGVVAHHAARVADHVGVALLEAEHPCRIEAGVHAREHGDVLGGRGGGRSPLVNSAA